MFLLNFFKSKKSGGHTDKVPAHRFDAVRSAPQRKPVGIVLRDTLSIFGVPADLLAADVFAVRRGDVDEVHVHLLINKWSQTLAHCEWALERQLLRALQKNEPADNPTKFVISWKFGADCQCPFPDMPDKAAWKAKPAARPAVAIKDFMERRLKPRAPIAPLFPPAHPPKLVKPQEMPEVPTASAAQIAAKDIMDRRLTQRPPAALIRSGPPFGDTDHYSETALSPLD